MKNLIRRFFLERQSRAVQERIQWVFDQRMQLDFAEAELERKAWVLRTAILDTYVGSRKS